jgi:hypothetical protein
MLREIGLATPILIVLTIIAVLIGLITSTQFGPLAGKIGVTEETALIWGQSAAPLAEATEEATPEAADEAAAEAEADDEATAEAAGE